MADLGRWKRQNKRQRDTGKWTKGVWHYMPSWWAYEAICGTGVPNRDDPKGTDSSKELPEGEGQVCLKCIQGLGIAQSFIKAWKRRNPRVLKDDNQRTNPGLWHAMSREADWHGVCGTTVHSYDHDGVQTQAGPDQPEGRVCDKCIKKIKEHDG